MAQSFPVVVRHRLTPVVAVVFAFASLGWTALPARAAAAVTLAKSAPATALAGSAVQYTLAAANPVGGSPEYNVTFRDELPQGVSYQPGSTVPAQYGEPTVVTAVDGHQTLLWVNVVDLAVGAEERLQFSVVPGSGSYPVASQVTNSATVYANTDPRTLPKFNPDGSYASGATETAGSAPVTTRLSAVRVTKTEPSPEAELLRGVHDHPTVYTLTVSNTAAAPTTAATLVDLIPAGLEFLGCGGVDNSTAPEYPGAPSLSATPPVGANCVTPTSVTTVVNPPGAAAGVYTRVEWTLGALPSGATRTVQYAAGIPQRANTAPFTAAAQTANLDNNTGAPTRETGAEIALTNTATVTGTYTGPVAVGGSVAVSDSTTRRVTAEDLALVKAVSPTSFSTGGIATYTLRVRAGEYAAASGIVLTDLLPDGLCPLSSTTNYSPTGSAQCAPVPGSDPTGAAFASVTAAADGRYTIVFTPVAVPPDGDLTVTFKARMGSSYLSTSQPTLSGDSYLNTVSLSGTTTPRPDVAAPAPTGPVQVGDVSEAQLSSDTPSLSKKVQPELARPYTCSTSAAAYLDDVAPSDPSLAFDEGDRVCFLIRVDFSTTNNTKNPVVTDFLPAGMTYEPNSAQLTSASTVPATLGVADPLTWTLGTPSGGSRFVPAGAVFEVRLSAIVGAPAAGPAPDVTANLAKFQFQNTSGVVLALRDGVDLSRSAAPPVSVAKAAARVLPSPTVPLPEGSSVSGGQTVEYSVSVTNAGSSTTNNALDVIGPDVYDVLPVGIRCADVSAISDSGVCTDPTQAGHPGLRAGFTGRSVIRWDLPASVVIPPAAVRTLTYRVAVPATESVSQTLVNTAAVSTYQTPTNTGTPADHAAATNILAAVTATDVPAAEDTHTLAMVDAAVTKTVSTAVTESGNTEAPPPAQATIGEDLTYTYSVVIPAGSSVYAGYLADPLPTGIVARGTPTARYYPDAASTTTAPLPTGVAFDATQPDRLNFPLVWTNATATDQRFEVLLPARVEDYPTNTHGRTRTNTATFSSKMGPAGNRVQQTGQATVRVVLPSPSLTKTNNVPAPGFVPANQVVTYTLRASNLRTRPPLHDAYVIDCVPAGVGYVTGSATPAPASVAAGDGTNGCPTGSTRLVWSLGDLAPSVTSTITYRGTVSPTSAGGQIYTNDATLSGSTLDDNKASVSDPDRPGERVLAVPAASSVTVTPSSVSYKLAERGSYAVGETARWVISVTVPAGANFFDTVLTDQLPVGLVAGSLVTEQVSCTYPGGAVCTVPDGGTPLTPAASGTSTIVGWAGGDFLADTQPRTVQVRYTATIADVPSVVAGSTVDNTATIRWNLTDRTTPTTADATTDRVSAPITASVAVTEPSLSLTKATTNPTPAPGDVFGYALQVTNATGADVSAAYSVTVVNVVPAGVVVIPGTITRAGVLTGAGPDGGGTITWTLPGPIAPGVTLPLGYDARVASPPLTDTLTNTASISGYRSQPGAGRSYTGPSASAEVTAVLPQIEAAKAVVGSDLGYLGEPVTFQVTLTNTGDTTGFGVDATDVLPDGWEYQADSATVTVSGAPLTTGAEIPTVTGTPQTLTWTNMAPLAPGAALIITYRAIPGPTLVPTGVGHSVAHVNTVTGGAEDRTGASGPVGGRYGGPPATATARVDSADLAIDKSHTATPVAGSPFSWTITVTNNGPDPAVGPWTVVDTLPAGVVDGSASGPGWSCSTVTATATITCTRPPGDPLAVAASLPTITVSANLPADLAEGSQLPNRAEVSGRTHDPDTTNNSDTDTVTVTASADLDIDKATSGPVVAGDIATWTIDLTNLGPSVSRGPVTITDTLPTGLTDISTSGTGWTCDPVVNGLLTCTQGDDITSTAPQLVVSGRVPSGTTASVTNLVEITSTTTDDRQPDNDTAQTIDTPGLLADLGIAKQSVDEVTAGSPAVYEFVVVNHGPSDATSVVVTDTLDPDLSYVSFTSVAGDWTCQASGADLSCELNGALPAQASATVRVTVDVAANHTGPILNTATVGSAVTDPVDANNSDDDNSAVDVVADLAIDKSHTDQAVAGLPLTYTLQVNNLGPSLSPGPVRVTDTVPAGMTVTDVTGTGWTCTHTDTDINCSRTGSALGETDPITVTVLIAPDAGPATLRNTAAVDGPADENPGNDSDSDDTTVVDAAELSVVKTADDPQPVAGTRTTFTLVATNSGPSTADGVVVTDTLPAGTSYVSADGDGWTCESDTPVCRRDSLDVGQAPPITVTVLVGAGVPAGSVLTDTAEVSTATAGDTPAGNTSSADITVRTETDLSVTKTHGAPAVAGTTLDYTLGVANAGPSDAPAPVQVTDTLPDGMSFVSASGGDWLCTPTEQQLTCTSATGVAAASSATDLVITVAIAADVTGTLTNTVHLAHRSDDTDPDNDTADDPTEVGAVADLSLVKTHTGTAVVGGTVTFDLAVHNAGPSTATAVLVSDPLPTGLTFVADGSGGTGWTCLEGPPVACTATDLLPPGADAPPLAVVATVTAQAYPSVTNEAIVSSDAADTVPVNDSDADQVEVPPLVNQTLSKSHTGDLAIGSQAHFLLTVGNAGPTDDPGTVTVTDTLPTGLTYVSATGDGWTCGALAQTVTCTRDGLGIGSSTIDLVVRVDAAAFPAVTNSGTVATGSPQTDITDDTASDTATVTPNPVLAIDKAVGSYVGTSVVYTITVTNTGTTPTVLPVVVTDPVPATLAVTGVSANGWTCSTAGQLVSCTLAAPLAPGSSAALTVTATVRVGTPPSTSVVNTATVSSPVVGGPTVSDTASLTTPAATPQAGTRPGTSTGTRPLAYTGAETGHALVFALLNLLVGVALVRRRRRLGPRI